MDIEIVDPRSEPGWDAALLASEDPAFFHSAAWAAVLAETYRFTPLYLAGRDQARFSLVMPLMEVRSVLTGSRGVSLPFTDFCPPFAVDGRLVEAARARALEYGRRAGWRFIEWRDGGPAGAGPAAHETYFRHDIFLGRSESALFAALPAANRRNIRKAAREGVSTSIDGSRRSLEAFYRLNCRTRRRHGLPPQPFRFFDKLYDHVLSKGLGIVALAHHAGRAVAGSVFLLFGGRAIFKYGASDRSRQSLRPNNLLMWDAMLWLKANGQTHLDLGRTEPENEGLLRFKRAWGGDESTLDYHQYSFKAEAFVTGRRRPRPEMWSRLAARAPLLLLRLFGTLAYRHIG